MKKILFVALLIAGSASTTQGQANPSASGIYPNLAMVANHSPRTEGGTGALMPWADRWSFYIYRYSRSSPFYLL